MRLNPENTKRKSTQRLPVPACNTKTADDFINFVPGTAVRIQYTNWQGVTGDRLIVPQDMVFGENEYHKGNQWLMSGFDLGKQAMRTFAMTDIHAWESLPDVNSKNLDVAISALKA
jgi:hypothetical protein